MCGGGGGGGGESCSHSQPSTGRCGHPIVEKVLHAQGTLPVALVELQKDGVAAVLVMQASPFGPYKWLQQRNVLLV